MNILKAGIMQAAIIVVSFMIAVLILISTAVVFKLTKIETPVPAIEISIESKTPAKTRGQWWAECMKEYQEQPGAYTQACFYYSVDMCKEHGCAVDKTGLEDSYANQQD